MKYAIKLCKRYLQLQDAAPAGSLAKELPGLRLSTLGLTYPTDALRRIRVMQVVRDLQEYCKAHGIDQVAAMEKAIEKM